MPGKPPPWYCSHCKTHTVHLRKQRYECVQFHDGRRVLISIDNLPIPTCTSCGHTTLASSTLEQITLETYQQLGLLTPDEIREHRDRLDLTQQQMQKQLGLGGNTMSRWEKGHIYQSKAHDRFIRVFFASKQVRDMLETDDWTLPQAPVEHSYSERFSHIGHPPEKPSVRLQELLVGGQSETAA